MFLDANTQRGTMKPKIILFVVAAVIVVPVIGLILLSVISRPPAALGVTAGRLASCPDSPNCVSSQADDNSHRIEPLAFTGPADAAWQRLIQTVSAMPQALIVERTDEYMYVEFTSSVFRFVDDVEFLIDAPSKLIHVRSASRVGRSDLGANRRRLELIRQEFDQPRH